MHQSRIALENIIVALQAIAQVEDDVSPSSRTTSANLPIGIPLLGSAPTHVPIVGTPTTVRTQVVLYDNPEVGTVKLHYWHGPDVTPPHDHPWTGFREGTDPQPVAFVSHILRGGYTEERFSPQDGGAYVRSEHRYERGDSNVMPYDVFHRVIAVDPGTVTLMITQPRTVDGRWQYLEPETFAKRDPDKDPNFIAALRAVNPHLVPRP